MRNNTLVPSIDLCCLTETETSGCSTQNLESEQRHTWHDLFTCQISSADEQSAQTVNGRRVDLQGLDQLRQNVGAGALLTATALREHYRLLEGEMAAENWLAVQALFRQQIRLVSALMPGSEDLSLLAYQFGTLQYCQ